MKRLASFLLIMLLMLSACAIEEDPELAKGMAIDVMESVVSTEIPGESNEPSAETPLTEDTITENPVFHHVLKHVLEASYEPRYMQWGFGNKGHSDRVLRVLVDELDALPQLIMVSENQAWSEFFNPVVLDGDSSPIALEYHVEGLVAGDTYLYALRTGDDYSEMNELIIQDDHKLDYLVFGDLQGYKASQYEAFGQVMEKAMALQTYDGIFFLGDVVDTGDAVDQWQYYMDAMAPVSPGIPILSAIGNHDVKGGRVWYNKVFSGPENKDGDARAAYGYVALDQGLIIHIDTEKPSQFEAQQAWLKALIGQSDKAFHVVLMHRSVHPIFYVEPHMQQWAQVFQEAGVDLVLSGHDHIYSRTEVNGVTYIVGGSGSGSKYYDQTDERPWQQVVYDDNNPVHMRLTINEKELIVTSYAEIGNEFTVIDELLFEH